MRIVALTDIHGEPAFVRGIREELSAADLVIICGDITHFGGRPEAESVLSEVEAYTVKIAGVAGNCDHPGVNEYLLERGYDIETAPRRIGGYGLIGVGRSLPTPGPTPSIRSEEELRRVAERGFALLGTDPPVPAILVSHQPPYGTALDKVALGIHVGSRAIKAVIERHRPVLCLTGHLHESRGEETFAGCRMVNPGPFAKGWYASIDLDAGGVSVRLGKGLR